MKSALAIAESLIQGVSHKFPSAILFGVTENGETFELGRHPDVYVLLDREYPNTGLSGIGVQTCGWAAPLNENGEAVGAPSDHPERRRVALVTVVTMDGMASALSFEDDPENPVMDMGEATGSLADAISRCFGRMG